ncbi:MAG TPA: TlpA disulfide reductase family protein [Methylomirabilota bacterium]|nr:TlpA disulfide reductase family protein [Methylomirabilota bacterium]
MSRALARSILLAAVLTAIAVSLAYVASRPAEDEAPVVHARPARPETPPASPAAPAPPGPASGSAGTPRGGRQISVDAAMRELDLIRPSRPRAVQDFTLPLLGGKSFRLAAHRGQVLLVNFWATWCPPCLEEMPALERLWRQHKGSGFVLLAVSLDGDPAPVGPFVAEHRLTFPVALDSKFEVANLYGVRALPATFIVDRHGNLAALALGPRTWDNDAAHSLVEGLTR